MEFLIIHLKDKVVVSLCKHTSGHKMCGEKNKGNPGFPRFWLL